MSKHKCLVCVFANKPSDIICNRCSSIETVHIFIKIVPGVKCVYAVYTKLVESCLSVHVWIYVKNCTYMLHIS